MESPRLADRLFEHERERLGRLVELTTEVFSTIDSDVARGALESTEVLLAGWGCPVLSVSDLDRMPRLKAVFFAGGSAATILDPSQAERRGIVCGDAGDMNAKGVAEYSFAMILLGNKRAAYAERLYRHRRAPIDREAELDDTGNYGATVGLIGASRIGRRVAELLTTTDLDVLIYDPYASEAEIAELGARKVQLDELLSLSDVVSIHAPATPETEHMIGARELSLLRDGAVLINTARGSLVDHDALLVHLRTGRLHAVLDVTVPEPLPADHELWSLPNVTLTPHIAGATGNELRRMGTAVVDQAEQFVRSAELVSRPA